MSAKNTHPVCAAAKKCGGCQLLDVPYEQTLKDKRKAAAALMSGICSVDPMIGMECPWHYRNKVTRTFGQNQKGARISGVYAAGTHNIVPVDSCLIENEEADSIACSIRKLLNSFKIKTYDEDSGYGFLRHLQIRQAHATGQIMVILVCADPVFPAKNNFVKALLKEHPGITTIILNVNSKHTSMVMGERNITLYGPGCITDILCGKKFLISPGSFYQVNSVQTEKLYEKAIRLAGLTGNEVVVDAYCGIGTISLAVSDHAKEVYGVELNSAAVKDARLNKKQNHVSNVWFYEADAPDFMADMAGQGKHADIVFMDPPRAGSTEKFMDSVALLGPRRVIYISCNPETLARDLKYFRTVGYKCRTISPFDMFPFTKETECISVLHKI